MHALRTTTTTWRHDDDAKTTVFFHECRLGAAAGAAQNGGSAQTRHRASAKLQREEDSTPTQPHALLNCVTQRRYDVPASGRAPHLHAHYKGPRADPVNSGAPQRDLLPQGGEQSAQRKEKSKYEYSTRWPGQTSRLPKSALRMAKAVDAKQ